MSLMVALVTSTWRCHRRWHGALQLLLQVAVHALTMQRLQQKLVHLELLLLVLLVGLGACCCLIQRMMLMTC
jgi:hypothetical protein